MQEVILFLEFLKFDLKFCVLFFFLKVQNLTNDILEKLMVRNNFLFFQSDFLKHFFEANQIKWPFLKREIHDFYHYQDKMFNLALMVWQHLKYLFRLIQLPIKDKFRKTDWRIFSQIFGDWLCQNLTAVFKDDFDRLIIDKLSYYLPLSLLLLS